MNPEIITSRDNSLLRHVRAVRDGRVDYVIFVEGMRLCEEALTSGVRIDVADRHARSTTLLIDTESVVVRGEGGVDLASEVIDLRFRGQPKQPRLRLRAPLLIAGTVAAQAIGGALAGPAYRMRGWVLGVGLALSAGLLAWGALSGTAVGFVPIALGYGAMQLVIIVAEARLQDAILDSYPASGGAGSPDELAPLPEHPQGIDPTAVFLARVLIPVGAANPPSRTAADVLVDGGGRRFVASVFLLGRWVGA